MAIRESNLEYLMTEILSRRVPDAEHAQLTAAYFGDRFLWIESFIHDSAASLCPDLDDGTWEMYELTNGGFYMAPKTANALRIECADGSELDLSGEALGIVASLEALRLLASSPENSFGSACCTAANALVLYVDRHPEAEHIYRALWP